MTDFIMRGGILVTERKPPPIQIFVDDTDLADHSAFIRAAVVFTDQAYRDLVVPKCQELLKQLGAGAKGFKAS